MLSPFCVSAVVRYRLGNPVRWRLEQMAAACISTPARLHATGKSRRVGGALRREYVESVCAVHALETRYSVGDTPSERRNIAEKALGLR